MLSEQAAEVIQKFFLEQEEFAQWIAGQDPHKLAAVLREILMLYANDKNSSTLREWVVLYIAGCHQQGGKIGYNGYKDDVPYEVKPRNIRSGEKGRKRLSGDGNFTDFTYERLEKYVQDAVHVLVAGFVDGNPIYVLDVPFECLRQHLRQQLDEKFANQRPKGVFLRSANFSFRDYENDGRVRCLFLTSNWRNYRDYLTGPFRRYLEGFEQGQR